MKLLHALGSCLLGAALLAPSLRGQQVLDTYSLPDFTYATSGYVIKDNTQALWYAVSGQLSPQTSNRYAAIAWTGNALENVGDAFSIDIDINPSSFAHNGGFSVWKSLTAATGPATPATDRVYEPRFSWAPAVGYWFDSENLSQQISGDATGWATLTLTLAGRTATDTLLSATLSGAGFTTVANYYTVTNWTGALYVGPSAYQAGGSNVVFDNFTYTAATSPVPEPSTYALLAGLAACGVVAWRRHTATSRSSS